MSGLSPITPRVAEDALLGRTIAGKYRVLSRVGAGGMGAVYKAHQIALEKPVAVKVLHSALEVDAHFVARFHVEAKAASMFDHPSSTRVIDFGEEPDGLLYIVMEFLEGQTLLDVIDRESPLAPPRVADILRQALAALAVAHERGILHRDLKPENIVLLNGRDDEGNTHDVVKVCDFGIAKLADVPAPGSLGGATTLRDGLEGNTFATDPGGRLSGSHEHAEATITEPSAPVRAIHATPGGVVITPAPPEVGPPITRVGLIIGTPEYMSPEQARGEPVDARSDLYSMGCVLYHMITGRPPFHGDSPLVTATLHATMEPKRPSELNPDVDPILERVCMHAMQKKLEDRYATAREMRSDLRALVPQSNATEPLFMPSAESSAKLQPIGDDFKAPPHLPGVPQRKSGFLLGGVLLVLGAASAIWMFVRTPRPVDPTTTTEITSVTADAGMGVDLSSVIDAAIATTTTTTATPTPTTPRPPSTGSATPGHGVPTGGTSAGAGNVSVVHVDAEHVPMSSVTAAVSRAILLTCYRKALTTGGGHGDGTTTIDVQMDNGKITKATLEDDFGLASLKGCVSFSLHNRTVAATEPGAHATVEVLFSDE